MSKVKPQPVLYNGRRYASTLEARIAVFLDEANARPIYEAKQYDTENGVIYTPDFWIRNAFIAGSNQRIYLWIEGKEALWSKGDETKMMRFSGAERFAAGEAKSIDKPLLVMNDIPFGNSKESVFQGVLEESTEAMDILDKEWNIVGKAFGIFPFNSNLVTGQFGPLTPCVKAGGGLYLGSIFDKDADAERSISAYRKAKETRFEIVKKSGDLDPGIYEFKLRDVEYDKKPRGSVNCPGWRLYLTVYTQNGEASIATRMHAKGFEWKVKDFCKSVEIPYDQKFMEDKSVTFWNHATGSIGRVLIKKNKNGVVEVADFWPADDSKPLGNDGAAEWERRHG